MATKQKDNSIKMAIGTISVFALLGLIFTHDIWGILQGACVGGLIVFIGEFYHLFKERPKGDSWDDTSYPH